MSEKEPLLEFYLFTNGCFSPDEIFMTHYCLSASMQKTLHGSLFQLLQDMIASGFTILSIREVVGQGTYALQRETTIPRYIGQLLMWYRDPQLPEGKRYYG